MMKGNASKPAPKLQTVYSMKEHAVLSKETPGQIYASHVASTTNEVKIALGKYPANH